LHTVIENPDDDVSRLVIADWYEENGQPERAEFIRIQIRLSRMGKEDPDYLLLKKEEEARLKPQLKKAAEMVRPVIDGKHNDLSEWLHGFMRRCPLDFDRGFIHRVDFADLRIHPKTIAYLFSLFPIQRVILDGLISEENVLKLVAENHFARVRSLSLNTHYSWRSFAKLFFDLPNLSSLEQLSIESNWDSFARHGMRELCQTRKLTRLRKLVIQDMLFSNDLELLLQATNLPSLTDCELKVIMSEAVAQMIKNSILFKQLKQISLTAVKPSSVNFRQWERIRLQLFEHFEGKLSLKM
jgi:uncharacterized protein (TIGR02996 family)